MNILNKYNFLLISILSPFLPSFSRITKAAQVIKKHFVSFDYYLILYHSVVSVKELRHSECASININCKHILFFSPQCVNE